MIVKTRIAPSPTGLPHIGTMYQALINYAFAKKNKGQFLVRIEDTDQSRLVAGAEKALFDALDWLGLKPDAKSIKQSQRLPIYREHAEKLIELKHAYYCFCSEARLEQLRKEQTLAGKAPMYDGQCRNLDREPAAERAKSEPHVIRLKVPKDETLVIEDLLRGKVSFDSNLVDDQVLIKSDGYPTYHLAMAVDDHLMAITHVVRGEEWVSSSPKLKLIYRYFGWSLPILVHTPILRNPDRSKLSKRHGHAAVSWYQQQGYLPEAVINFLITRVWNHPQGKEVFGLDEIIKHFDFKAMHLTGPIVDLDKLNWLNGQWLRRLPEKQLWPELKEFLPESLSRAVFKPIWPLLKDRLVKLSDLPLQTQYFVSQPQLKVPEILGESRMTAKDTGLYLIKVAEIIKNIKPWAVKNLENKLHQLQVAENLKPRPAFMTIRLSVTGSPATPPLFDVLHILGQTVVLKRLQYAQKILKSR